MTDLPNLTGLTERQRDNLKKLADYLAAGNTAMRFDMASYCCEPGKIKVTPRNHACGTVACAVGHGPAAGIDPEGTLSWSDYVECRLCTDTDVFHWLFAARWQHVDNTPEGAAGRITWYLDKGLPADFLAQVHGEAPLCYRPAIAQEAT